MYTESSQTTGHHRFLHYRDNSSPCRCQHCVHYEQPFGHHGGLGYQPASARQTDHPYLDCWRDIQAPRVKDVGGRAFLVDPVERSGHRSPQRRPVFAEPRAHYGHSDELSQVCPWEFNSTPWTYALESGPRHYQSVRKQCGCVMHDEPGVHAFKPGTPHPLPHLQVKGQEHRHERTVRYVVVDEKENGCERSYLLEPHGPALNHLSIPNGHCHGQRPALLEGGEESDRNRDWGKHKGGSEEESYNGRNGVHEGFFATEVPQKHLNQSRRKGPCNPCSGITIVEKSSLTNTSDHQQQDPESAKPKRRQDAVRDQIRQVVADLEDVLGGLKQVHVEMKEVVEQIDRLTANIDLSEASSCSTLGVFNNADSSAPSGDIRVVLLPNHQPTPVQVSQHAEGDRIILRTNAPSPVHTASVVKTSRFTPPSHSKDVNHEKPSVNGHPPHLTPYTSHTPPEPRPQNLEPKVIIGNSTRTSGSTTQKPPPYPQNGRCCKAPYLPPKPAKTPAYPGRGRQSTSIV